ncbi:bifunctional 4-hydroxy-2-oxoglutarate aldolase/2-dehydro-3-deoxy-phosphogluconate aldolase [Allostreptomyces psammosilenae]|uniref:2-dehydro-3-deoxyphosphogluconate aldolase/(4S)-4-hydroxy-2-oxoglutarate aldolase n=1 Tax=Allostreptomyces psammosilenae TaxID=1892865 RepID=A0A853A1W1_9ACTN|nr:bifunctional 4-hydroxy-2-oxoglutarate aldolase/2-dehydro-3-deoxy-phosphogluconate aldolase [Allostreptomyces psammosilenae]NYI08415.1 2-dehydro-3-deoxyphosphogluconate aldolase/(4S)-4-hydroxy-2-oxoglutarate aldolase [Allostreptomyces psammosilenae]
MNAALQAMAADRVLTVVRAPVIPDAARLCEALAAGGIRCVELTYTTPDLVTHLRRAASTAGCFVGAGTVLTGEQAAAAVDAGARFLVTPGIRPEVAEVAAEHHVPLVMGAFTPSEVIAARELGAAAVKIFPAHLLGPRYLKDLRGPLPGVPLVPSGGVNAGNAADFLAHGALAVSAGTDVVPPDAVADGDWAEITRRARQFTEALR